MHANCQKAPAQIPLVGHIQMGPIQRLHPTKNGPRLKIYNENGGQKRQPQTQTKFSKVLLMM